MTSVLKPLVGRARPPVEAGAYAFRAFAGTDARHAFPSGHATHAFALAAGVADEVRRPWLTAAAYGTAALVGWSRVHDDQHWASDVVAGAAVGTAASLSVGRWLRGGRVRHFTVGPRVRTGRGRPPRAVSCEETVGGG